MSDLQTLHATITTCQKCPRLITWCQTVAQEKRKMFKQQTYWGKPVAGFGDPDAQMLIIGLAPAAHGANRTGRMFTGDRSGQWLFRALHRANLSNQDTYQHANDGLTLHKVWVTNMVRCAPPQNKPTAQEKANCFEYFTQELAYLTRVHTIIALGGIAWDGLWKALQQHQPDRTMKKPKFGHCAHYTYGDYTIIGSYHPSQQNTFTGRLTQSMFDRVFIQATAGCI